jgi:hypothetical protein
MREDDDDGHVVFPIEKMVAARELSSCCLGAEAALEKDSGFAGLMRKLSDRGATKKTESE